MMHDFLTFGALFSVFAVGMAVGTVFGALATVLFFNSDGPPP